MENNITRAEVLEMIEVALASFMSKNGNGLTAKPVTEVGKAEAQAELKKPTMTIDERGNRVVTSLYKPGATLPPPKQTSRLGFDEFGNPYVMTKEVPKTTTEKKDHLGGGQGPLGGSRPTGEVGTERGVMGGGERVRVFAGGQGPLGGATGSRSKEAAERAAQAEVKEKEAKDEKPAEPEQNINEVIAGIITMFEQRYVSRDEVDAKINEAVPSELRMFKRNGGSSPGTYLMLEPGALTVTCGDVEFIPPDTTDAEKYMPYQVTDDATSPKTLGFDWVRAHA